MNSLAGFAAVAAARGKVEAAARLYGAAEAQYQGLLTEGKTLDSLIDPVDRREFERYQGICRDRLGEAAFEAAWAAGREHDAGTGAGRGVGDSLIQNETLVIFDRLAVLTTEC